MYRNCPVLVVAAMLTLVMGQVGPCGMTPPPDDLVSVQSRDYRNSVGFWIPESGDRGRVADELRIEAAQTATSALVDFGLHVASPWLLIVDVIWQIPGAGSTLPSFDYYVKTKGSSQWAKSINVCPADEILIGLAYDPGSSSDLNYDGPHVSGLTAVISRGLGPGVHTVTLLEANEETGNTPNFFVTKGAVSLAQWVNSNPIPGIFWDTFTVGGRGSSATIRVDVQRGSCGQAPDSDGDGATDNTEGCPNDPNKTSPGHCGCGVLEVDSDNDGVPDCMDACPNDLNKTELGSCGCGVPETPSCGNPGDSYADRATWYDSGNSSYAPDEKTNQGRVVGAPDEVAAYIAFPPNKSHSGVSTLTVEFDNGISNGSGVDLRIYGLKAWDCRSGGSCTGALVEIGLFVGSLSASKSVWIEQKASNLDIDLSDWFADILPGIHHLKVILSVAVETERCGESWTGFYCGPGASVDALEVLQGNANSNWDGNSGVPSIPVQIAPADGTVLGHFPRLTDLSWRGSTGSGTVTYEVQVEILLLGDENWHLMESAAGMSQTTFTFTFSGKNLGRWRVRAQSPNGLSQWSPWWSFEYSI